MFLAWLSGIWSSTLLLHTNTFHITERLSILLCAPVFFPIKTDNGYQFILECIQSSTGLLNLLKKGAKNRRKKLWKQRWWDVNKRWGYRGKRWKRSRGQRRWKRSEGEKGDENEVGGKTKTKWGREDENDVGRRDENDVGGEEMKTKWVIKVMKKKGGKGKNKGKRLKKVKKRRW